MNKLTQLHYDIVALMRTLLFSFGGEMTQSIFHFVLNLTLIRVLTAHDYGVFAIALILGGIVIEYTLALVSVPATAHLFRLKSPGARRFQDVVFGSAAVAMSATLGASVCVGLRLALGDPAIAISAGALTGLWAFRFHLRVMMFVKKAPFVAAVSDLSYALIGTALIAPLLWFSPGQHKLVQVFTALACAHAIAIAVGLGTLGTRIRVSFRRSVRRYYRSVWSDIAWSLVGVTSWTLAGQAPMFLVAAMVGPAAYAPIGAGIVLFNPLRTALGAFINVIRPELATGLAQGLYRRVALTVFVSSAVIVTGCVAFSAGIWLFWEFIDRHLYGDKFADVSMPLIVTLGAVLAIIAISYHVPLSLIQVARNFKAAAFAMMLGGTVGLVSVFLVLLYSTVPWSLVGVMAGEATCFACLWYAAFRVLANVRSRTADTASALALQGAEAVR